MLGAWIACRCKAPEGLTTQHRVKLGMWDGMLLGEGLVVEKVGDAAAGASGGVHRPDLVSSACNRPVGAPRTAARHLYAGRCWKEVVATEVDGAQGCACHSM